MATPVLILGAGMSGLSASYHVGHDKCLIVEADKNIYGHCKSVFKNGFTWDEGPHVSFTKHSYVREMFEKSVDGEFDEYEVKVLNYSEGCWVDHPVQSNLYQLPTELKNKCVDSLIEAIEERDDLGKSVSNYNEWLIKSFGRYFSEKFPKAYTRKYWAVESKELTTSWVGKRMYLPSKQEIYDSVEAPLSASTHYITKVRYPKNGGYQSFIRYMAKDANININSKVIKIDLQLKEVLCDDGLRYEYDRLISSIPLPLFVECCVQAPDEIKLAAKRLKCTELLLVNVEVPHEILINANWIYVYDEDKYSTRIHYTNKLTQNNVPQGFIGLQVEVYSSQYKTLEKSEDEISKIVIKELSDMGLIKKSALEGNDLSWWWERTSYANVLFDHEREESLELIFSWLSKFGLIREQEDLDSTSDWNNMADESFGDVILAGRFGQWKYYWSDDCLLRGLQIGNYLK